MFDKPRVNSYNKQDLEPVRNKIGQMVMSMDSNKQVLEENVLRVKGKALNTFLGIVKTDMPRLAIEAFPEAINKKLSCL